MESANPLNHGPNRFSNYLDIHNNIMEQYLRSEDFVLEDTLEVNPVPSQTEPGFLMEGEIGCLGCIVITVEKFLTVVDGPEEDPMVQTEWYSYNVSVRGWSTVFRYDNQHPEYLHPGHKDRHHKHEYDLETGEEAAGSPIWTGADRWPHLSEVMEEAREWYWNHRDDLPDPEGKPELGLRG